MARRGRRAERRPEEGGGAAQRRLRVGEAVRPALSETLERAPMRDPELAEVPVTVTEVRMSADLRSATAHVVPLGGAEGARVVAALNRAAPALRRLLAPTLAFKFLPTLRFSLDTSFDHAARIEALLAEARAGRTEPDPGSPDPGSDGPEAGGGGA